MLLAQDHYLPYDPVQERLETALEDVLEQAREAGFPMKVALIASDRDLGAYPQLFNRPQEYADLLSRELATFSSHGEAVGDVHLLVVMPVGFGGNDLGEKVDDALRGIAIEPDAGPDGLAKAAVEAVARLATANGHDVPVPPEADLDLQAAGGSADEGTSPLVYVAPALLLVAALVLAGRMARRREPGESE